MQEFAVYDDIPIAVCILRKNRKRLDMLYANAVFAEITGLAREGMKGQSFTDVWPAREASLLIKKLKEPAPPKSFALPAASGEDGRKRWIGFDITEGLWHEDQVFILFGTDISSTKAHEQELLAAVEKADALSDMKSNFLATVSHEIRTPMQTIYGLLEIIADENRDPKIGAMVGTAQGAAAGLLEILDDVLDLAKMDADKMDLDIFEVPVRTLVRGILEAMAVKIHGKPVILKDEIAEDVPFVITGDPKRLRQIIMNLTGNAMKFTESGSVTVRVSRNPLHIRPGEGQIGLRFEVVDTGIGMSAGTCARLFQAFTQADNSTSRKYGGTGLGLSICKKLVELMDGRIGVFSAEGAGSTFWFEIPAEEVGAEASSVPLPFLDGISVLSVEDHPQGAKEIMSSLRSMGAKVESCGTFAEGLALAKRRPFDVAVIDQGLPDGLGLDLIKEIMEIRPFMGVIMYTVRDDPGLQHSLQSLGVTYLSKPAGRAGLGGAVRDAAAKSARGAVEGPSRLLIAEDTESVRDILRRQLEKLGVEADFVANGREALAALESGLYGILITDLHMPDMDGYALASAIRKAEKTEKRTAHFPVIVLTADVQMAQRETYLRHGFDECLLKPVSLGQFRRLLVRWGLLREDRGDAPGETGSAPVMISKPAGRAVDIVALADMMGGFDDNAQEMLQLFADMTAPLIARLRDAQDRGDDHDMEEAAHSLKGAARSACCVKLGDLAAQLQEAGDSALYSGLVEAIEAEFARVRAEIGVLGVGC